MTRKTSRRENVEPLRHPDAWRGAFIQSTIRTGFCLALTQPMLEFLCAVADGVWWDRMVFQFGQAAPACCIVTARSLEKRGLITWNRRGDGKKRSIKEEDERLDEHRLDPGVWCLTPAGKCIVDLFRVTGIFVEASAATELRARGEMVRG